MSSNKRKIEYFGVDFVDATGKSLYDKEKLVALFRYINQKEQKDKIIRDDKTKKAISFDIINDEKEDVVEIVFKSCKYNHSPDYMSSKDGAERPTDKKIFEGEKEITHFCFNLRGLDNESIYEKRSNGITLKQAEKYLNSFKETILGKNVSVQFSIIPSEEFSKALNDCQKITAASIYVDKTIKIQGSSYLDFLETDENIRDEVIISFKCKRGRSILKDIGHRLYNAMVSENQSIKRVRLSGENIDSVNMIIDSLKGAKQNSVDVELDPNGIVNSDSMFAKLEELIE